MLSPHERPQPLGLFAGEQLERAGQYLEAFERLANTSEPRPLHAMYFLLTHAFELFFKAYLAARGVAKKETREPKLRHNLPALLSLCEQMKLPAVADLREYISSLHEMNQDHDFRYVTSYNLSVPPPAHCIDVGRKLQAILGPIVDRARIHATLDFAAETRHLKGRKIRWSD